MLTLRIKPVTTKNYTNITCMQDVERLLFHENEICEYLSLCENLYPQNNFTRYTVLVAFCVMFTVTVLPR